jgi:hypothetical protein
MPGDKYYMLEQAVNTSSVYMHLYYQLANLKKSSDYTDLIDFNKI